MIVGLMTAPITAPPSAAASQQGGFAQGVDPHHFAAQFPSSDHHHPKRLSGPRGALKED